MKDIRLVDVGHRFGSNQPWLYRRVNVTFRSGRIYAITGPSGAGKSTLLGMVAGWIVPAEGSIEKETDLRSGWVFQGPVGTAQRSAIDHVILPYLARGLALSDAESLASGHLRDVGLTSRADSPFSDLSGGEAQRLMLARGVAANPALLLIDEPTAQLDSATAATVAGVVAALRAEDRVVLIATHDEVVQGQADEVIDLRQFATQGPET